MSKIGYCPFCDGAIEKKEGLVLVCVRCSMKFTTDSEISEGEFLRRFNRRVVNKRGYAIMLDSFMRNSDGTELLRVLHDYQPCTKEEILKRKGYLAVQMDENLDEAMELNLVKSDVQDGHTVFLLTDIGKRVFREVTT